MREKRVAYAGVAIFAIGVTLLVVELASSAPGGSISLVEIKPGEDRFEIYLRNNTLNSKQLEITGKSCKCNLHEPAVLNVDSQSTGHFSISVAKSEEFPKRVALIVSENESSYKIGFKYQSLNDKLRVVGSPAFVKVVEER